MGLQNKRSVADAEQLISDYFQCGQSRKEFCQEHGIKLGTFQWWMKRHNDTNKVAKKPELQKAPFVQITPRIQPVCTTPDESEIVIDLKSGMRIRWRGKEIPLSFYRLLETLNNGVA
jgi:transposase-like protein